MKAQGNIERLRNPKHWFDRSRSMWRGADVLAEVVGRNWGAKIDSDTMDRLALIEPAYLLYGLAVETACKARLLQRDPTNAEFDSESGSLRSIRNTGPDGHDLVRMGEALGLLDQANGHWTKKLLSDLAEYLRWKARYPGPKKASLLSSDPDSHSITLGGSDRGELIRRLLKNLHDDRGWIVGHQDEGSS